MISFDFRNQLHEDCMKVSSLSSKNQSVTAGHCTGSSRALQLYLDGDERHVHDRALPQRQAFGFLADHVVLQGKSGLVLQRDNSGSFCSLQNKQTSTKCPPRTMINRD